MNNLTAEKLTTKDAEICRAFRAVILKGKFDIQGEAVTQVGSLFRWFSDLDKRIEETVLQEQKKTIRKELK